MDRSLRRSRRIPQPAPVQNQASFLRKLRRRFPRRHSRTDECVRLSTASAPQAGGSESETVIENDVYRIVFTNRGARVKSWVLKKYTDDKGGQLELVNARGCGEVWVSADVVVV